LQSHFLRIEELFHSRAIAYVEEQQNKGDIRIFAKRYGLPFAEALHPLKVRLTFIPPYFELAATMAGSPRSHGWMAHAVPLDWASGEGERHPA
jgi:hypothetical protein